MEGILLGLRMGCKTLGSTYLGPTKPTRHRPFQHHLLVQMKSYLRYLLEQCSCSGESMGGDHYVHYSLLVMCMKFCHHSLLTT
jgi:hypothetical protein